MHPLIRRDLLGRGQLDHVAPAAHNGPFGMTGISVRSLASIWEYPAAGGWHRAAARPGLAAIAFDLDPAQAAVEALPDGRRRLRGSAVAFHLDRPRVGFGAICFTGGFICGFAGTPGADLRAHDLAAPDDIEKAALAPPGMKEAAN
jgi:hypothetical protein